MSVAEEERTDSQESQDNGHGAALKAAGAAAATGAAAFAVQKVLSHRSGGPSGSKETKSGESSILSSAASGGWEAARDAVVPLAENAAGAAGKYLAEHGPEFLRERVVPRFIEGFNKANS